MQNGSLYIHVYFTKSGFHPDPKRKGQYRRLATVHSTRSTNSSKKKNYAKKQFWGEQLNRIKFSLFFSVLNKYKRRKFLKTKNLLTGETEADPEMIKVRMIHGSRSLLRTVDI